MEFVRLLLVFLHLLGMGMLTRQAKWNGVIGVLASWIFTLPCAALLAAPAYWLLFRLSP